MAIPQPPQTTAYPEAPQRGESEAVFISKANAFVAALDPRRIELQNLANYTYARAVDVETLNAESVQAAADAVDAAKLAAVNSRIFTTVQDGLNSSTEGEYFSVPGPDADDYLTLYRVVSGAATVIDTYPNKQAVIDVLASVFAELSSNSTGSGSDDVAHTGTTDTVTQALDKRTIYVGSVAELEAMSLPVGTNVYLTEDGRAGEFVVKTGTPPSDPQKGIYIVLANGNYAERTIVDGTVYLKWFSPIADGVFENQDIIQSAINLTPTGYTLSMDGMQGTYLVDIPADPIGVYLASFDVNKAITVKGAPEAFIKIKDFCSAYVNYSSSIWVFKISASGGIVDGVNCLPNASNHYEESGGFKFWETGPLNKTPPSGGVIHCELGQPNVINSQIINCTAFDTTQGFAAKGSVEAAGTTSNFIYNTATTDVVVDPLIKDNYVEYARGNANLFIGGVRGGVIRDNRGRNLMYHMVRFYDRSIGCKAFNNKYENDYSAIAARWNPTDLGYWRTDNDASSDYTIKRVGYKMGSGFTASADGAGNVRDCSMKGNHGYSKSLTATAPGSTVEILSNLTDSAALFLENSNTGMVFSENQFTGGLKGPAFIVFDNVTTVKNGARILRNTFDNVLARGQTAGAIDGGETFVCDNELEINMNLSTGNLFSFSGNRLSFDFNTIDYEGTGVTPLAFVASGSSEVSVNGNTSRSPLIDKVVDLSSDGAVGSNCSGRALALINSFAAASSGTPNTPVLLNTNSHEVHVTGSVDGSASASSVFADVDSLSPAFRPLHSGIVGSAIVTVAGSLTSVGQTLSVYHDGFGSLILVGFVGSQAGTFALNLNWPTDYSGQ